MAVRVRLRIKSRSREVVTSTLINSGFEAEEPQLVVPLSLAEALGLTSAEASIEDFRTAGGGRASGYRVEKLTEVQLVLDDRSTVKASTYITVLPGESEAIMSDRLASELDITILDAWRGHWCLRDELGTKQRSSAAVEEWK
mgnify:CR=1 FL=1